MNAVQTMQMFQMLTFILTDRMDRQLRADHPGRMAGGPGALNQDKTGVQPGTYFVPVFDAASKMDTRMTLSCEA